MLLRLWNRLVGPDTRLAAPLCCAVALLLPTVEPSCGEPSPSTVITVTGSELLAWDQEASDAFQVSRYRYVAYVDNVRQALPDAGCQGGSTATQFVCSARLPQMSAGAHRLELAAVVDAGSRELESDRSAGLVVFVASSRSGSSPSTVSSRGAVTAGNGARFNVETLAGGFVAPSALAVTPDGRILVADQSGVVWVWQSGQVLREPALTLTDTARDGDVGLVGLALHPDFSSNRLVYVVYTARSLDGTLVNRLVRYRELASDFGEGTVILEDAVAELPRRTPRLRFGPDRKLYVALAAGSDQATAESFSSYSGKILRLNEDGTTPGDNPRLSPIVSFGHRSPAAFDWQPATGRLWLSERGWDDRDRLSEVELDPGGFAPADPPSPSLAGPQDPRSAPAGAPVARLRVVPGSLLTGRAGTPPYVFDSPVDPSGAAFYQTSAIAGFKDNLFVAGLGGEHIRRVRFDPLDPKRVVAAERLLDHQFGRIADIVAGPDGALYFCTSNRSGLSTAPDDDRLARLVPAVDVRPQ